MENGESNETRTPKRRAGTTRAAVAGLIKRGLTITEISGMLGVSKPTVCYHARKLGHPRDERFNRRYDWTEVQRYYDEGHSITACQQRFGFARKSSWTPSPAARSLRARTAPRWRPSSWKVGAWAEAT